MRLTFLVPAALAAAFAAQARAADDDVDLARALAQRGYADLAERVLLRAAAAPSSGAPRRAEVRLTLAQLRRWQALRAARSPARSAPETLRLFEEAETAYRALLGDPAAAWAARGELARLLVAHARAVAANSPSSAAATLAAEALALLGDDALASASEDDAAGLLLLRIEALHAHGAALPRGDAAASASFARALEEIEQFTWDHAGTLRCAWAFRWRGVVLRDMGKLREACESLRDAASSVTQRDDVPGADEMALSSYAELAEVAAEAPGPDGEAIARGVLEAAARMPSDWPSHLETPAGRRARLALARLRARLGDRARAAADARDVLAAAGDDDAESADEACRLLASVAGSGGGTGGLDPETLSRVMRATAAAGDLRRTVNACRAVISASTTAEARDRWAWDAWQTMGRAYGAAGRWYEAYLAFDRIERAWRTDPANPRLVELTEATAWFRADALSRLAAETQDPQDRAAAEAALAEFSRDHPGSGFASGAREQHAFRVLAEAASLRRSGDRSAAAARAREAIDALAAIGPESPLHERAEAFAAEAHRLLGDADAAVRLAEAWLAAERPDPATPGARRTREQGRLQALVTLFSAMADRAAATRGSDAKAAAFQDLLGALERREEDFLALAPDARGQIDAWRAEALLGSGDAEAAEPLVAEQMRTRPNRPGTRYLAACTAGALEAAAAGATEPAAAQATWLRAARLWEFVLDGARAPDADLARSAGMAFLKGGEPVRAADLLALAASLYRTRADAADAGAERSLEAARTTSVDLAATLLALQRTEEAASEAADVIARDAPAGAGALGKLAAGETLREGEVTWMLERAARSRRACDVLAAAYAASGAKERLGAAVQVLAALRLTLPRDVPASAESCDLAIRLADASLRLARAGGPAESVETASRVLEETFGTAEALAAAEALLPGARARVEELLKLLGERR